MERIDHIGFETTVLPFKIAYHTDDDHIAIHRHCAELLEILDDLMQIALIVYRHRHAHLRCDDHIDRRTVCFEYLKHFTQESIGKKHSAALDLDGCDIVFAATALILRVGRVLYISVP